MTLRSDATIPTSPVYYSCPASPVARPSSAASQRRPLQYRIEERRRTIFVTSSSDEPPTIEEINKIFNLVTVEIPEEPSDISSDADASSSTQGLVVDIQQINPDSPSDSPLDSGRTSPTAMKSPLVTWKVAETTKTPHSPIQRFGSPRTPIRPRILFYHKNAPYYGFTNFSTHPVIYRGKRYPTSEHLFQSFKVIPFFALIFSLVLPANSFKDIAQTSQNTFDSVRNGQA